MFKPSYNLDAEQGILGGILVTPASFYEITSLKAEHFYDKRHQAIYACFVEMSQNSVPIDLITTNEYLRKTGREDQAGGVGYLVEITSSIFSAMHIREHAAIVQELAMRRNLRLLGESLMREAEEYSKDSLSLAEGAEKALFEITRSTVSSDTKDASKIMMESIEAMENAKKNKGRTGVPSGFRSLDSVTGGWQNSDLIILAARPSQGKTALALNYALNAAKDGFPVLFFSLEMSAKQLGDRILSSLSMVPNDAIRTGTITQSQMDKVLRTAEHVSSLPLYISDASTLTIPQFRAISRKHFQEKGVRMIIVDYLQLMSGNRKGNDTRETEVAAISRAIKGVAKELNVPVIALSQLSRQTENRGGFKRPILSDLRESGAIEQDADIVTFIHRLEYYGITEDEDGRSTAGAAEIIFAKHRNGKVGIEKLGFDNRFTLFSDYDNDVNYFGTVQPTSVPDGDVPF